MEKVEITKNQIISELSKSPHGKLSEYLKIGQLAARKEPEFLAHLIAWDRNKGQIRDAKAALPIVTLSVPEYPEEFIENSLAHLATLNPRELLKAYRFALEVKVPGRHKRLKRLIASYLKEKEKHGFEKSAVQHRAVLKELYSLIHLKPGPMPDSVLFGPSKAFPVKTSIPEKSLFKIIPRLKDMSPREAAGTILEKKIPFLIAHGALGDKAKDPDLVLALINQMTPTEVVTNTKMLEKLGVKNTPALRAAYEAALEKAAGSKKNTFKTTKAAEAIGDKNLKAKLNAVQEKQIKSLKGIEGNWLVLGDRSGSMEETIEVARIVAGTLAKMVKGKVILSFFDTTPQRFDVTGKTYDEIVKISKNIRASGGTSIGCGLSSSLKYKDEIDGIAIISDAQENSPPFFFDEYRKLLTVQAKDVPVYLYRCAACARGWGDRDLKDTMTAAGYDLQEFVITGSVDYYSIPNMVESMRTNQYSLADEIMGTELLTLKEAFKYGKTLPD